jgi:hypothetical protein
VNIRIRIRALGVASSLALAVVNSPALHGDALAASTQEPRTQGIWAPASTEQTASVSSVQVPPATWREKNSTGGSSEATCDYWLDRITKLTVLYNDAKNNGASANAVMERAESLSNAEADGDKAGCIVVVDDFRRPQ